MNTIRTIMMAALLAAACASAQQEKAPEPAPAPIPTAEGMQAIETAVQELLESMYAGGMLSMVDRWETENELLQAELGLLRARRLLARRDPAALPEGRDAAAARERELVLAIHANLEKLCALYQRQYDAAFGTKQALLQSLIARIAFEQKEYALLATHLGKSDSALLKEQYTALKALLDQLPADIQFPIQPGSAGARPDDERR